MPLIDLVRRTKFGRIIKNWLSPKDYSPVQLKIIHSSISLQRDVTIDIYLPASFSQFPINRYPALIFNDGQDMSALRLTGTLAGLTRAGHIPPIIVAAVHAGDRLQEYGTASRADYKGRGKRAAAYSAFITNELLPRLQQIFRASKNAARWAIAGCSLGGLSALDIAWQQPELFKTVGVFSGSLWWRDQAFSKAAPDANRIMHRIISSGRYQIGMRFWFQTGTEDEIADRNKNGIIDAIDDTLDLLDELQNKGYQYPHELRYREIEKGKHDTATWAEALPDFLIFAFGKRE